jgi:hypothetical protein
MTTHDQVRKLRLTLDPRYQEIGVCGVDPCVYCGVISSEYDHVPPLVVVEQLSTCSIDLADLRKYPACHECNGMLGASLLGGLRERRTLVRERLANKYAHFLWMPAWSEDELSELEPRFADDVLRHAMFAAWVKAGMSWARGNYS